MSDSHSRDVAAMKSAQRSFDNQLPPPEPPVWSGPTFHEPTGRWHVFEDGQCYDFKSRDAAVTFMRECGQEPAKDTGRPRW
jgi:hypothetical protein